MKFIRIINYLHYIKLIKFLKNFIIIIGYSNVTLQHLKIELYLCQN